MENKCLCCGGKLSEIINLGLQPLANKYPKDIADFDEEFTQEMVIYLCEDCGYCYLPCDADRKIFFEEYYYLSSVNKELVTHFNQLANKLVTLGAKFVLDVGSNDGVFLKPLKELGVSCLGVDPSENVGAIANKNGLETFIGFFDNDLADRIITEKGRPDMIVASSVFTHLEDPGEFFSVCNKLLDREGVVIIEVEFINDIIESLGFERFYFDRPHYYTVESLRRLALQQNFGLVDVERIDTHGGSIRVTFKRIKELSVLQEVLSEKLAPLNRDEIISQFKNFKRECNLLVEALREFKINGIDVLGYGCPARFSTITNFASIGPNLLPFVIDDSPLKQGRHSPGQHIPIISSVESPHVSNYLVFAYEYINSIRSKVSRNDVNFLRPIPYKMLK